jgi:NTP pyrophosphatase (non-canonical NTP hydrolase)
MMIRKLYKIAEGLNTRFPEGNDPFRMITRLTEECGDVAALVNQCEQMGGKAKKKGFPNKPKFARELQSVMTAALHLAMYYGIQPDLEEAIEEAYQRVVTDGLVMPLPADRE